MSDFREEEALGKLYDRRTARRLFRYLRPYKSWVVAGHAPHPAHRPAGRRRPQALSGRRR